MATFWRDLLMAARSLFKTPGFAAVAIFTLALGIGINATVFGIINGVLLRPFPFPEPGRVVVLDQRNLERGDTSSVSYPDFQDWKQQSQSFESLGALEVNSYNLAGGDQPERVEGAAVSAGLFETLAMQPVLGRPFQAEDLRPGAAPVVILGHSLWQRRFGSDPRILDKVLVLDNEVRPVVGVMPPGFKFPLQTELWIPLPASATQQDRSAQFLTVLGRLKKGVSVERAQSEVSEISRRIQQEYPATNKSLEGRVSPLRDYFVGNVRPVLLVLLVAVGFVLLIVCANLANLILSRGLRRQRDIAIRVAIGAKRFQLVRLLLLESFVLTVLGGLGGLLLARLGLILLTSSLQVELPYWMTFDIDGRVIAFTIAIALLSGFFAGLLPSLKLSRVDLSSVLREGGASIGGGRRQRRLSHIMVIVEVTLSLVLLLCATLMVRSFMELQNIDPGFDPEGVLTAQISDLPKAKYAGPGQITGFYREVMERIQANPGVESVAAALKAPLAAGGSFERGFKTRETVTDKQEDLPIANYQVTTTGYFGTLEIPLIEGRVFTEQDGADAPQAVIINQRLAKRLWPSTRALGQQISIAGDEGKWRSIVGVVGDTYSRSLGRELTYDLYVPHQQTPMRGMTLLVRSSLDTSALAATIRREVRAVDANQPVYSVKSMRQVISESLVLQRFTTQLIVLMGLMALILASVGLYGVVAYAVSQQTHEIGLRMALGAQTTDILRMVVRRGLMLGLIGIGVGLPLAFGANRLLASVIYGVDQAEILMLVGIMLLFLGVAALASFIPARRATRVDPLIALRKL